jgi:hypothetical protein
MREATRYSMRKQQHAWGYEIFHEKTTTYVRLQDIPWENNNMREATRYSMRKQQLAWFDLFDSLTYSWQVQVYKQNNKDLDIQMALWIYVVIVTNEIDDTIELSRGPQHTSTWQFDSVIDFIRDNHNIRPRDNSIVSSISLVTITTYVHVTIR